jgi:hypothetical protein
VKNHWCAIFNLKKNIFITIIVINSLIPGIAFASSPSLSVSPIIGTPGTEITVTGAGFPENRSGTVWFDTNMDGERNGEEPYAGASTDSSGKLTAAGTLSVPSVASGNYPVRASISTGSARVDTYNFFIVNTPILTTGLKSGPPGTSLIAHGVNFAPDKSGWIWFDSDKNYLKDTGEPAMWITANDSGEFYASLIVPDTAPEAYPVIVDFLDDGVNDARTTFTIVPQMVISPTGGTPGTVVSISGKGYGSGSFQVWLDVNDNNQVDTGEPQTDINDVNGLITATLVVDNVSTGTYPVKIRSGGTILARENFTVKGPGITLNTGKGLPGQTIVVTGSRFPANATGRIWFDTNSNYVRDPGELDKKVTTGSPGNFTASISIPGIEAGVYAIRSEVPEGSALKPSSSVSVLPAPTMTLSINNNAPGTIVIVNGKDFKARTSGTVWFDSDGDGNKDYGEQSAKAVTDAYGSFRAVLTVPQKATPGAYVIYADIPNWGKPEAWVDFFVNSVNPALSGELKISNVTPYDGAVYVHRLPTMKLLFNNTIVKGPDFGSIDLSDEDGNTVKVNATLSGKTLSIRPVGMLKGEKTYVVLVPALAALDTKGSGLAEDFIITFKTRL